MSTGGDERMLGERGGLAILVLDDDPLIGRMLERVLVRAGHDVEFVSEVEPAFERAMSGRFDAVLSDQNLHDEEGLAFLDRLEARLRRAGRPVPALFVMSGDRRSWPRPHVTKPFDLDRLQAMLDELVTKRRGTRS